MSRKLSYIANKATSFTINPFKSNQYKNAFSKSTTTLKAHSQRTDNDKDATHSFSLLSYHPFSHYFSPFYNNTKYLFKSLSFFGKIKANKKMKNKVLQKNNDSDTASTKTDATSRDTIDVAPASLEGMRTSPLSLMRKKKFNVDSEFAAEKTAVATKAVSAFLSLKGQQQSQDNNAKIKVKQNETTTNSSRDTQVDNKTTSKALTQSNDTDNQDNSTGFNLLSGEQQRDNLVLTNKTSEDSFTWTAEHTGTVELDIVHHSRDGLKIKVSDQAGQYKVNAIDRINSDRYEVDVIADSTYQIDIVKEGLSTMIEYDFSLKYGYKFIASNYAILFSGGYNQFNNHDRYDNAMEDIYKTLTTVYNVNPKNIYVLYADGDDNGIDLSDGTSSDLSYLDSDTPLYSATNDNLDIAATDLLGRIDSNDNFLFWTFDHGFGDKDQPNTTGEEGLNGWNAGDGTEELVNDEFILEKIQPIMEKASSSTLVLGQCYAGGVLDEFQTVINDINDMPGKSALGMSAANHFESSYGSSFVDEFNNAFQTYNSAMTTYKLAHDNDVFAIARGTYSPNTSTVAFQDGEEHPWVWPGEGVVSDFQIMNTPITWFPSLIDIKDIPVINLDKLLVLLWDKYFIEIEFPIEEIPPFPEPIPPCPVPFSFDQLQAAAITEMHESPINPMLGFQITDMQSDMMIYTIVSPALFNSNDIINNANSPFTPEQQFFNIQTNSFQSLRDITDNAASPKNALSNEVSNSQPSWIAVEKVNVDHFIMPNDILLIEPADARSADSFSPFSVRAFNGKTVSTEEHEVTLNNTMKSESVQLKVNEDEAIENIAQHIKDKLGVDTIESWGQPYRGSFQSSDDNESSFDYEPSNDYYGSDSFTVQYLDKKGNAAFAQVNIDIQSVNDAAIAVSDQFNVEANTQGVYVLDVIDPKTFTSDYDPDHNKSELKIQLLDNNKKAVDEIKDGNNTVLKVVDSQGHQQVVYTPTDGTPADVHFHYQLVDPDGLSSNIAFVDVKIESGETCRDMKNKIETVLRENQINLDALLDINQDQTFDTNDTQYLLSLVKTNAIDVSNSPAKPVDVVTSFDQNIQEALFEVVNTTYTDDGTVYHLLDINRDGAIDKDNDIMPLHQAAATCNDQNDLIAFLANELCEAVA